MHTVAVWNGVRDYRSRPPTQLIERMHGAVTVAQIAKPIIGKRSTVDVIDFFIDDNLFNSVILWSRNGKVYQTIVDELRYLATLDADYDEAWGL
jgi:hypothetical protein